MKDAAEETAGGNTRLVERLREQAAASGSRCCSRSPSGSRRRTRPPARRCSLDAVTAGYAPGRPALRDLSFTATGPERVAMTGPYGSGKSALLALVAG